MINQNLKEAIINLACGLSTICIIKYVYNELTIWHDWFNLFLGVMTVSCYIYMLNFYINSKKQK